MWGTPDLRRATARIALSTALALTATLVLAVPSSAVSAATSLLQISAGSDYTCAVASDGDAKCWGINDLGELGNGTTTDATSPVDVSGLTSGVAGLSASQDHACAVTTGGGVKCWGYNGYSALGDGTSTDSTTPVDVSGLSSGVAEVSAGYHQTCALTTGGAVKCWGNGPVGNGSSGTFATPVDVSGLASGVAAVSAGEDMDCVLTTTGGVKCWGVNTVGQLGDGTTTAEYTPVDVSGFTSGVVAISSSFGHTCALTTGGGVKCWGANSVGQLGDGTTSDSSTPVDVSGLSSGVAAISAGEYGTCALTTGGGVKCWGLNQYFPSLTSTTPFDVPGLSSGIQAISLGGNHLCALSSDGTQVKCLGWNGHGQLGDGTTTDSDTPVDVQGLLPLTASFTGPFSRYQTDKNFEVAWMGSGGFSPYAYDVKYRGAAFNATGFSGYSQWQTATSSTSGTFTGRLGHTYCFGVQAVDAQSTPSGYSADDCTTVPLDDRSFVTHGGWSEQTSSSDYQGTHLSATSHGAYLTLKGLHARHIAILVTTCVGCGSLAIYWNGKRVKAVSLSGVLTHEKMISVLSFTALHTGAIKLMVTTSGKKVLVDGLGVSRV